MKPCAKPVLRLCLQIRILFLLKTTSPAGLAPDQGISEQQVSAQNGARQQGTAHAADLTECLPRVLHGRTNIRETPNTPKAPAQRKRDRSQSPVSQWLAPKQPNDC